MKMKVPFFDLVPQFVDIEKEIQSALGEVFKTQQFILGPQVKHLEQTIAHYCQTPLPLVSPQVRMRSFSRSWLWTSGQEMKSFFLPLPFSPQQGLSPAVGATPVFVDIDSRTFNIDPSKIEEKITPRTKAIIPVHLYGQCADMEPILQIAKDETPLCD